MHDAMEGVVTQVESKKQLPSEVESKKRSRREEKSKKQSRSEVTSKKRSRREVLGETWPEDLAQWEEAEVREQQADQPSMFGAPPHKIHSAKRRKEITVTFTFPQQHVLPPTGASGSIAPVTWQGSPLGGQSVTFLSGPSQFDLLFPRQ
ncbi:hypothetical protein [Caballeronia mineralivorans]|uniref:hypothetical protein n=1 Tax=Caballeronia mineralivorans TaxID=2010198 RepID=UPI001364C3C9|nr:hypothetical protein [Caballeronia mineralivorans]